MKMKLKFSTRRELLLESLTAESFITELFFIPAARRFNLLAIGLQRITYFIIRIIAEYPRNYTRTPNLSA